MPWGAAVAAVGGALASKSASKDASKAARRAANQAKAADAQANLGFGLTRVDAAGNITQDENQFTDLSRAFGEQAMQFLSTQPTGIDLQQAGVSAGNIGQFNNAIMNQFGNLSNAINTQPQFDPNAFAALQFDRLNSLASRGEEIAANRVANNLFARGRAGANDTQAGNVFSELARAQGDARTQRALTATNLANQEAQRLFQQNQVGIQNQFGLLGQLFQGQQGSVQDLIGLTGFNSAQQQQQLQNALGFAGAAGSVLQPNFQTLTAVLNRQATDQSARAGVSSTVGDILGDAGVAKADAIGNAFAGIGQGITDRWGPK